MRAGATKLLQIEAPELALAQADPRHQKGQRWSLPTEFKMMRASCY